MIKVYNFGWINNPVAAAAFKNSIFQFWPATAQRLWIYKVRISLSVYDLTTLKYLYRDSIIPVDLVTAGQNSDLIFVLRDLQSNTPNYLPDAMALEVGAVAQNPITIPLFVGRENTFLNLSSDVGYYLDCKFSNNGPNSVYYKAQFMIEAESKRV
jgi:hypothetical protein